MRYIINNFEGFGTFAANGSFFNKDGEECIKGRFNNNNKEYTFIVTSKDTIL